MIKENGTVVAVHKNEIVVEVLKTAACQSCKARQGCGQAVLAEWGNEAHQAQKNHFRIPYQQPVQIGDTAELGMSEDTVTKVALLVYLVPLVCGFVGLLLSSFLTGNEWIQLVFLALFSGVCFVIMGRLNVGNSTALIPQILRTYSSGQGRAVIASDRAKSL